MANIKPYTNRTGIVSMFSGLFYCVDCGQKIYYSATNNYKHEYVKLYCLGFRKDISICSKVLYLRKSYLLHCS